MKTIKIAMIAFMASMLSVSCNDQAGADEDTETVIIREKEEVSVPAEKEVEDDGNSINFKVETDKDGKVSGGVEGDVELDKNK